MDSAIIEEEVVETIETLRQLCICIENYQNETEPHYFELLTRLSSQYKTLQQLQDPLLQAEIPFEVLELVDQEQNPDQFVEKLEQLKSVKMDQYLGKKDAIEVFLF